MGNIRLSEKFRVMQFLQGLEEPGTWQDFAEAYNKLHPSANVTKHNLKGVANECDIKVPLKRGSGAPRMADNHTRDAILAKIIRRIGRSVRPGFLTDEEENLLMEIIARRTPVEQNGQAG